MTTLRSEFATYKANLGLVIWPKFSFLLSGYPYTQSYDAVSY